MNPSLSVPRPLTEELPVKPGIVIYCWCRTCVCTCVFLHKDNTVFITCSSLESHISTILELGWIWIEMILWLSTVWETKIHHLIRWHLFIQFWLDVYADAGRWWAGLEGCYQPLHWGPIYQTWAHFELHLMPSVIWPNVSTLLPSNGQIGYCSSPGPCTTATKQMVKLLSAVWKYHTDTYRLMILYLTWSWHNNLGND